MGTADKLFQLNSNSRCVQKSEYMYCPIIIGSKSTLYVLCPIMQQPHWSYCDNCDACYPSPYHITVNPHTKCVESESVLSMTHVWRFWMRKSVQKQFKSQPSFNLGVTPASPLSKSNFICKQSQLVCFKKMFKWSQMQTT